MAQSNKILTVSYGTFSCTLEGFDNPFAAMQSIAEYFRDLAAEDRYFGAEPPQPDAQMLHQIAEREEQHRVDARVADGGLVLRPTREPDEAGAKAAPPETTAPTTSKPTVKDAEANDLSIEPTVDDKSDPPLIKTAAAPAMSVEDKPGALSQITSARQVGDADGAATVAPGLATSPADRAEVEPTLPEDRLAKSTPRKPQAKEPAAKAPVDGPDGPDEVAATHDVPEPSAERAPGEQVELAKLMTAIAPAEMTSDGQGSLEDGDSNRTSSTTEETEDWVEVDVEGDDGIPRVVGMSRAQFQTALENGALVEIEDDQAEAPEASRRTLAEASMNEPDATALAADLAAVEPGELQVSASVSRYSQAGESGDRTVSRLLDETNVQMDDSHGHRRRAAIQHLRAAVAATKADGALRDRAPAKDASIQKFRDDLQQAVRPTATSAEPENPLGPLVLVSSQRVDSRLEPVRPARPGKDDPALSEGSSEPRHQATFADFAARIGARDLPDLLEAAAAYSKVVEGQDGAPRPVLIQRATAVAPAGTATREDGLKSFGQLLRAGRLRKIDSGRFALADDAQMAERARAVR